MRVRIREGARSFFDALMTQTLSWLLLKLIKYRILEFLFFPLALNNNRYTAAVCFRFQTSTRSRQPAFPIQMRNRTQVATLSLRFTKPLIA